MYLYSGCFGRRDENTKFSLRGSNYIGIYRPYIIVNTVKSQYIRLVITSRLGGKTEKKNRKILNKKVEYTRDGPKFTIKISRVLINNARCHYTLYIIYTTAH